MADSLLVITACGDREWAHWLEPAAHDFYHTAAYHRFSEKWDQADAFLTVYGSRRRYLAWPYLLRPLHGDLRDVTSVYGYAGPLAVGCNGDSEFLDRALARITALWFSQGVVSAFTRFHPLLANHRGFEGTPAAGRAVSGGETVCIDLAAPEQDQWRDYQPSLRNRIHRGRRLGLRTETDDSWAALHTFTAFYHATMRHNRAAPQYFFPLDYFSDLHHALGPHAVLMLTRLDGEIAAAGIFIEYAGIVQNHFCMNNQAFRRLAPSKVLLDDVRRWACERGNRYFHLGGGRGGSKDSLFDFKAAFSRWRLPFYTGRWIVNAPAYRALCGDSPADLAGFFPAYRAAPQIPTELAL